MTEASDLLLFKLRGKGKEDDQTPSANKIADEKIAQDTKPLPSMISSNSQLAQQENSAEEGIQNKGKKVGFLSNLLGFDAKDEKVTPIRKQRVDSEKIGIYDGGEQYPVQQKRTETGKKLTKDASMELAKSLTCLVHPWRSAYAVCNYCKMGYCFADIIELDDGYYCLEDSGKIEIREPFQNNFHINAVLRIAVALFFMISILLFIYTYKQASFIASNIGLGALLRLPRLPYVYAISIFNMILAILAFIGAMIILAFTARSIETGEVISGTLILIMSYEYMVSGTTYLLGIVICSVAALACVVISRIMENTEVFVRETNTETTKINWPRLETFG